MKKGWTTTKLIAVGAFVALDFVIELTSNTITVITGIPLMSGVITAIIGPIIGIICILTVNEFGTFTIYQLIFSFLALPTYLWGPPGFFPKIIVCLSIGILVDLVYLFFKKVNKFLTLTVAVLIMDLFGTILFLLFGRLFKVPGVEKTAWFISSPFLILTFVLVALIVAKVSLILFDKIKKTPVIGRFKGI